MSIYIYIHDRIHICVASLVFPGNSQKKHPEICVLKLRLRLFGFFGFLLHMFFSCLVRMRQNQRAPPDPSYFIHPVGLTNVLANWMLSICWVKPLGYTRTQIWLLSICWILTLNHLILGVTGYPTLTGLVPSWCYVCPMHITRKSRTLTWKDLACQTAQLQTSMQAEVFLRRSMIVLVRMIK